MDRSLMSEKASNVFDMVTSNYMNMYHAGLRDGFEKILDTLKEIKEKGEEVSIDDLIAAIGKLVRTYDGELTDDDKKLEDRETAPKEFKDKGMSDEAFRSLMNFKKMEDEEKELEKEKENNEEEIKEETGESIETEEAEEENTAEVEVDPEVLALLYDDNENNEGPITPPNIPMMGGFGGMGALAGILGGMNGLDYINQTPDDIAMEESKDDSNIIDFPTEKNNEE